MEVSHTNANCRSVSLAQPDAPLGDLDELLRDVDRYLAAVDLFRALGHEPIWRCDELIALSSKPGEVWQPQAG
jgi:hypothetical protein